MYFPDRGCVHTLLMLYVYATGISLPMCIVGVPVDNVCCSCCCHSEYTQPN